MSSSSRRGRSTGPYLDAFTARADRRRRSIDAAVSARAAAKFELGLFEQPYVDVDSAAHWNGQAEHLARRASRPRAHRSCSCATKRRVLPLAKSRADRSPSSATTPTEARLGGYSGPGIAKVSILDGIRAKLGAGATVRYAPGPGRAQPRFVQVPSEALSSSAGRQRSPGLRGEYFDNNRLAGPPRLARIDARMDFRWTLNSPGRGIPFDWYSVRWTGTLTAPPAASRASASKATTAIACISTTARHRQLAQAVLRHARYGDVALRSRHAHDDPARVLREHGQRAAEADLGRRRRRRLVWRGSSRPCARARERRRDRRRRASRKGSFAIARFSGAARPAGGADSRRRRDAARRPSSCSSAAARSRCRRGSIASAVLSTSGIRASRAGTPSPTCCLATTNPAGRLPITFPMAEGQLPLYYNHKPTGRGDDYVDLTGQPLFPFGFGLSYTTFEYSDLDRAGRRSASTGTARCASRSRTPATRAGDEVVQLYVRDVLATVARPVMELAGFRARTLGPGRVEDVDVRARGRAAAHARRGYALGRGAGCVSRHGWGVVEGHSSQRRAARSMTDEPPGTRCLTASLGASSSCVRRPDWSPAGSPWTNGWR